MVVNLKSMKLAFTAISVILLSACASMNNSGDAERNQDFVQLLNTSPTAAGGYGTDGDGSLIYVQTYPQYMGSQSFYATVRIIQYGGPTATHKVVMKGTMTDGSYKEVEAARLYGNDFGPADYKVSTSYGGMGYPHLANWYFVYTASENGTDYEFILDSDGFRPSYEGVNTAYEWSQFDSGTGYGTVHTKRWKRTIIFMYGETQPGQDMFIRGGLDHGYALNNLGKSCTAENYECAVPIYHVNSYPNEWRPGDYHLDWYGTERYQLNSAQGSPLVWTTNDFPEEWTDGSGMIPTVDRAGYGEIGLNTWGHHYWMLDVYMDCNYTVNGWFELKSFISNGPGWEGDAQQQGAPYQSNNHFAKCGNVNMFRRGSNDVESTPLSGFPSYQIPNY